MNMPPASEHHPIRAPDPTKEERHAYNSDRSRPRHRPAAPRRRPTALRRRLRVAHRPPHPRRRVDRRRQPQARRVSRTPLGAGSALRRRIGPSAAAPASPGRPPRPDRPRPTPLPAPRPGSGRGGPSRKEHLLARDRAQLLRPPPLPVLLCQAPVPVHPTTSQPVLCRWRAGRTPAPEPRSSRSNDSCPSVPSRRVRLPAMPAASPPGLHRPRPRPARRPRAAQVVAGPMSVAGVTLAGGEAATQEGEPMTTIAATVRPASGRPPVAGAAISAPGGRPSPSPRPPAACCCSWCSSAALDRGKGRS